jgi:Zinc-binding dehydrogenase
VKIAIELGVTPDRINTIIDFAAAKQYGVKTEGSQAALNAAVLAELAQLIAAGELEVPIAATFPLGHVRDAFRLLEQGPHPGQDRASAVMQDRSRSISMDNRLEDCCHRGAALGRFRSRTCSSSSAFAANSSASLRNSFSREAQRSLAMP